MPTKLAVSLLLVAALVGLWWFRQPAGQSKDARAEGATSQAPRPVRSAAAAVGASAPRRAPVPTGQSAGPDPYEGWDAIERAHANRKEAPQPWGQQAVGILNEYFDTVNDVLRGDPQLVPLVATPVAVDCRDGSCTAELHLNGFAEALAYVEMFRDGRFRWQYGKTLNFECPIKDASLPRTPGEDRKPFPVLLHFDCVL